MTIAATGRGSVPLGIAESGGYRIRFPASAGVCEGVLINTGGGMAGGDRMTAEATLASGAAAVLTTQGAERIYRSDGLETEVAIRLDLAARSRLDWLPQEQILFDGSRIRRSISVQMAQDAHLILAEIVVFGRLAMGETVRFGAFRDRWRVRRDHRLVFAEDVMLEGSVAANLERRTVGDGARALATVLCVGCDAEARAENARAALEGADCEWGLSAWDGMLLARFLSRNPQTLRIALIRFLDHLRGGPMPRSWQT